MYKTRPDRKFIMVQNGQQVEYHASFNFPGHVLSQMKQKDIDMLKKELQECKAKIGGTKRTIQQLQQENDNLRYAAGIWSDRPPEDVLVVQHTSVSQVTYGKMMGGRNEQQTRKMKLNEKAMTISTILTTRRIRLVAESHLEPKPVIMASNECDSNADTCCLRKNFVILEYIQRMADVYAYHQ